MDFRTRTRKQKGVGNNLFDNYLEVVTGMAEVDNVLSECEKIGVELSQIMKIWASGASTPTVKPETTLVAGEADVGLNLVDIPAETALKLAETSSDPAVRKAFEGYLKTQPEGVPSTIVLKDYQMLGVNWLNLLYARKTSCILADEMGKFSSQLSLSSFYSDITLLSRSRKDSSGHRTYVTSQIYRRERTSPRNCTFFNFRKLDARIFSFRSCFTRRKLLW